MPEPSKLVLLEQLRTIEPGTKVRFLACVHSYDLSLARLVLRDKYPVATSDVPTAIVDISILLENVNHELLEIGAWLNIVGYIAKPTKNHTLSSKSSIPCPVDGLAVPIPARVTLVKAMMMWSASAIKLDRYESAVRDYQKTLAG